MHIYACVIVLESFVKFYTMLPPINYLMKLCQRQALNYVARSFNPLIVPVVIDPVVGAATPTADAPVGS